MPLGTERDRLADYVRARRIALGLERADLAARMGMVSKTVERIETGKSVRADTYAKLEISLGWAPGSVRRILDGGEPVLLQPAVPSVDLRQIAVHEMANRIREGGELRPLSSMWAGRLYEEGILQDPLDILELVDEARVMAERNTQGSNAERDTQRRHA